MTNDLPPFSCSQSRGLAEFLQTNRISVALSTYQAGKVIFISALDRDNVIQLPRNFDKPMGIAFRGNKMAIAVKNEVIVFANNKELAGTYPKQPSTYDNLFVPRSVYYTGEIDLHDLHWSPQTLMAVNTRFSCLATIDDQYSFRPFWQPPFIKQLLPEDSCHLNGLAVENEQPAYVTALGETAEPGGWRANKAGGGILMDVRTSEIILRNLPMPHSPRVYKGQLYVLLSATGELVKVDVKKKTYQVVRALDGFARGMDISGDYVFIGLSKLRTTSQAFGDLPIARRSVFCGFVVVHLPTGSVVHQLKYENSVEEIYDVVILPDMPRPGILNHVKEDFRRALAIPGQTFWAKGAGNDKK